MDLPESPPILLSGNRPTGALHLGHWAGTLRECLARQEEFRCTLLVADLHSLTSSPLWAKDMDRRVMDVVLDWLSLGFDPAKVVFIQQSQIPELSELSVLLSMLCSVSDARRIPALKERLRDLKREESYSLGLLNYPILMAADILLLRASRVSVGADQVAHVELAKKLGQRFNQLYGPTFLEPQALLSKTPRLVGLDGQKKMSKSLENAITLRDDPGTVRRRVLSMDTDPKRLHRDSPGTVEGNPVFDYHDAFGPDQGQVEELKRRYRAGTIGDGEVKEALSQVLNAFLEPVRMRRREFEGRRDEIRGWLRDGTAGVRREARSRLAQALQNMGLPGFPPAAA